MPLRKLLIILLVFFGVKAYCSKNCNHYPKVKKHDSLAEPPSMRLMKMPEDFGKSIIN